MRWNRILAMIIVCGLFVVMPSGGFAAVRDEAIATPWYLYTQRVEAALSISSEGVARCTGGIRVKNPTSTIQLTVSLYKQSGTSWIKIAGWSDEVTGALILDIDEERTVGQGKYKVVTSGTITAVGGGAEDVSATSSYITYP